MSITQDKLRNVAIIAHVDHGKTTLVDQLFKQSGMFRDNEQIDERLMDSMDLEKERGITIKSKNGACLYNDHRINIIDTPGHADFGGEVERVLKMADGALFLVDAAEGPMPQSYFVLKKAVSLAIPIIVVVNKIDKPAARSDWVVDQVFDLLVQLNAPDDILDFPILYTSAKDGIAKQQLDENSKDMSAVFESILTHIPCPKGDANDPLQLLISSISYSNFVGRLGIGKITSGSICLNQAVILATPEQLIEHGRITKIYHYERNHQVESKQAICGDIVAVSGLANMMVGKTITSPDNPCPLDTIAIDPPTMSMIFLPNDSPFSGKEGEFVTGNHIKDRLEKETLSDIALHVEDIDGKGFKVSGRGELHLSILIEKMRREGYEFQVSSPTVIIKTINQQNMEPYEDVFIEVADEHMGAIIESLGLRKGQMIDMSQENGMAKLHYSIPTRGLLGYLSEFMTQSKGLGILNSRFSEYGPYVGEIKTRQHGVMISNANCTTVAYALFNLQERGALFLAPGEEVYEGQIIGESARDDDLVVNPAKGKKLTNMRASGSDDSVILTPARQLSLEQCMAYISKDELLEVTPKAIRLRKLYLSESERKQKKSS